MMVTVRWGSEVDHLLPIQFPEVTANVTAVPNSSGRKLLKNIQVSKSSWNSAVQLNYWKSSYFYTSTHARICSNGLAMLGHTNGKPTLVWHAGQLSITFHVFECQKTLTSKRHFSLEMCQARV